MKQGGEKWYHVIEIPDCNLGSIPKGWFCNIEFGYAFDGSSILVIVRYILTRSIMSINDLAFINKEGKVHGRSKIMASWW